MINIEKTTIYGVGEAVRGMRNPLNSWGKSDSVWCDRKKCGFTSDHKCLVDWEDDKPFYCLGDNDYKLMRALAVSGSDHAKYLRMITVYADITAPLYWWKEYDTYKVGTVANSCSTMHKITSKDLSLSDFSHEYLSYLNIRILKMVITAINDARYEYLNGGLKKDEWWQMIQLLPTSYNQKRTVELNYAVLRAIYHARKDHKLDEWHDLCKWIEKLPYSELIMED